ncbi:MAG: RtcB family protein [Gammaproteobacteria bacterium]|nr:RtcB family protein [Gammaproteobacteria bacterium]
MKMKPSEVAVKAWNDGVEIEEGALQQAHNTAQLGCVMHHVALMPDAHLGYGATVGSVIPTRIDAIIPAAVGVDIGCGMIAQRTTLRATDLPDSLRETRLQLEKRIPHGRTAGGRRHRDRGAWGDPPRFVVDAWKSLLDHGYSRIVDRQPRLSKANSIHHLGTMGTGNHFLEMCLDESDGVWLMLHSGSRGIGAAIGNFYIEKAKESMGELVGSLPDKDLAYLVDDGKGVGPFNEYVAAVEWAQSFARINRELMMGRALETLQRSRSFPSFEVNRKAVNCHHNYVARESHFGSECWITRKGAIRAGKDELGIIPGSMGARSYIVRGKGESKSFESCSHGAGRRMSRNRARKSVSEESHAQSLAEVECRKDASTLDETPAAYKDIDAVMRAQRDLIEPIHTLRQVLCVKG